MKLLFANVSLPGDVPHRGNMVTTGIFIEPILDPFAPKGWLNYHRGLHLAGLPDEAIDVYVEYGTEIALVSSPMTRMTIYRHGGAVSRIPDERPPPAIATRSIWLTRSRAGGTRRNQSGTSTGSEDSPRRCDP